MGYGHVTNGRGLTGMLFLKAGTELSDQSLFLGPGQPQDWMIQASSAGFDLEAARKAGLVRCIWIPPAIPAHMTTDAGGARVMDQLVRILLREEADRVLINDFTPLLQFRTPDAFRTAFVDMMSRLDRTRTTMMLMMPEPVSPPSRQIIDFMKNHLTGTIHVSADELDETRRCITLIPGTGHTEHVVVQGWRPYSAPSDLSSVYTPAGHLRTHRTTGKTAPLAAASEEEITVVHEPFLDRLQQYFDCRSTNGRPPFSLVALRVDSGPDTVDRAALMEHLLQVIEDQVADPDDLLADLERRRIIVLLNGTDTRRVQSFFETIQRRIGQTLPELADQLPHLVSAVVIPDGQPFESPRDFLAYALEGR